MKEWNFYSCTRYNSWFVGIFSKCLYFNWKFVPYTSKQWTSEFISLQNKPFLHTQFATLEENLSNHPRKVFSRPVSCSCLKGRERAEVEFFNRSGVWTFSLKCKVRANHCLRTAFRRPFSVLSQEVRKRVQGMTGHPSSSLSLLHFGEIMKMFTPGGISSRGSTLNVLTSQLESHPRISSGYVSYL